MKKVTQLILDSRYNINTILECMNDLLICAEKNKFDINNISPHIGICGNTVNTTSMVRLQYIMNHWPNHSGDHVYPVKSGSKQHTPRGMYDRTGNKYIGAYGKRRINLLKWLIKEFEIALEYINKQ